MHLRSQYCLNRIMSTPIQNKINIAVFASGNGSNAQNIIEYFSSSDSVGRVALIVCNKKDAYVLTRAEQLGVPAIVISRAQLNDPQYILPILEEYNIDFIALAGFLLMIPSFLIGRYEDRIVNIHPSLLPKYGGKGMYGHFIHEAVVEARESESGITIHKVNSSCDDGEIVFQTSINIAPDDTADDVEAKIHALEKIHYPRVIDEMLR